MTLSRPATRRLAPSRLATLSCVFLLAACSSTTATTAQESSSPEGSMSYGPSTGSVSPTSDASTTSPTTAPPTTSAPDCTKLKCIALTFDDGPDPTNTPKLLDVLEREKTPMTMFLVGKNVRAYPKIVQRERDLGLELANHTYTHLTMSKASDETLRQELTDTQKAIKDAAGVTPSLMRPPYAARNKRTDKISGELGLAVVTWNTSPVDWENHNAQTLVDLTVNQASPNSIVLMHDIHPWSVEAVPQIITKLKAKGYTFVTVGQLLGKTTPGTLYPS